MMRYTFVTVAHAADAKPLHLQARSLERYLSPSLVDEIIVVENWGDGAKLQWRDSLRGEYGWRLRDYVRFIDGNDIAAIPAGTAGWWAQQVLKLKVAEHVKSLRYVALDAKNHLCFPLRRTLLEDDAGKMMVRRYSYRDHPLRDALERTLRYFGIDPETRLDDFTATVTPFVFDRHFVREVIRHISAVGNAPFAEAFLKAQLTEFFAYAAYLDRYVGLDRLYTAGQPQMPTVWKSATGDVEVTRRLAECDEARPFFAIQRSALRHLSNDARYAIAQFWLCRGLIKDAVSAVEFLQGA